MYNKKALVMNIKKILFSGYLDKIYPCLVDFINKIKEANTY